MGSLPHRALALCLLVTSRSLHAADTPRDIVRRAINATGLKQTDQPLAVHLRYRLITQALAGKATVQIWGQTDGTRARLEINLPQDRGLVLLHRDGKDQAFNGGTDMGNDMLPWWRQLRHTERVAWLLPLLQDPTLKLSLLKGNGIEVKAEGLPTVRLEFDGKTGLLTAARTVWSAHSPAPLVIQYEDYREIAGNAQDEKLLERAGLASNTALLNFVKKQSTNLAREETIRQLIGQLGDDSFKVRQRATVQLCGLGRSARPWLREATRHSDAEIADRARQILERLGQDGEVLPAVLRALPRRRIEGGVPALMGFLSQRREPEIHREALAALAALAHRDGRPDPVLVRALEGPQPWKSLAEQVLGKDGGKYLKSPGRRLFLPSLKLAHRVIYLEDGKEMFRLELEEVSFFNRHEERLFEKPKARDRNL